VVRADLVDDPADWVVEQLAHAAQLFQVSRNWVYINCWHMSEYESAAMWGVYAPHGLGVAVRSTYARLVSSLTVAETFHVGMVQYIDYSSSTFPDYNFLTPFLYKRRSFDFERELRAVIVRVPNSGTIDQATPPGLAVDVDVPHLIEAVHVAPGQPTWFRDAVESVVEALGPKGIEVRQSRLDEEALF